MRKSKKNFTLAAIEEDFLRRVSPSGIVATYIYNKREKNIIHNMK